ncbi:glutamate receptor ionotropic, delta-1 [Anabrus simplex]|uniref:glutamate receptor ionotropic, delta-1 n=1 Tax=Anabrus simplex TaxID=316456 RepID=UPI0035A2E57D
MVAANASLIPLLLTTLCSNYPLREEDQEFRDSNGYVGCNLRQPKLLAGRTIKIVTLKSTPLSNAYGNGTGDGIAFDFVELLRKHYGFEYTVTSPQDNSLGDESRGIMSTLYNGEAEMAAAFLPWFPEFEKKVVRYSVGLMDSDWVVLLKRPPSSAAGSGLLAPFDDTVWYLILAAVICTGPVFYVLLFVRFWLVRDEAGAASFFSLGNCVWFVFGALMKQGSTLNPTSDSSRMLFATWWIFITILTSFYTANLTAFLTLSKFTLPIENAYDVARWRYKWVAQRGGAIEHIIAVNPDYAYLNKSFAKGYGRFDEFSDTSMLNIIEKENRFFLREKYAVEHMISKDYYKKAKNDKIEEKDRCTFVMTPRAFMSQTIAFAYNNDSDLHKYFDPMLQTLVETGIVKYLMRRDLPGVQICPLDLGSKERQLMNADLKMTYLVVVVGIATSIAVFMGEMLIRLYRHCQAKQIQQLSHTSYPGDWKTGKSHMLPYTSMMAGRYNGGNYKGDAKLGPAQPGFVFQYSA